MPKRIIITAGPTRERIDSVMKITNMSTGRLSAMIADTVLRAHPDEIEAVYYVSTKMTLKPSVQSEKLRLVTIESAEDMLNEISGIMSREHIDAIVHAAAVGDYKARYTARAEDMAHEIAERIVNARPYEPKFLEGVIFDALTNPKCVLDDNNKMSSCEPNMMTMMDLTPKVIKSIKKIQPEVLLIGCKLLDGVPHEKLLGAASGLIEGAGADYILANDLSRIGGGKHWAMVVGKGGVIAEANTKQEIADIVDGLIFGEAPADE